MFGDWKPKAILFDFYHTLVDIETDEHRTGLWERLAWFLRYRGLIKADPEAIRDAYFAKVEEQIAESDEEYPDIDVPAIFGDIMGSLGGLQPGTRAEGVAQLFRSLSMVRFEPYPDARPTLEALKGRFGLGLVSDAQRAFLEPELETAELGEFFLVRVISSDFGYHKPDPRTCLTALEKLGVAAEDALYVGDTPERDVAGAHAAGIRAVLLDRSGVAVCRSHQPDAMITSLTFLADRLTGQ